MKRRRGKYNFFSVVIATIALIAIGIGGGGGGGDDGIHIVTKVCCGFR